MIGDIISNQLNEAASNCIKDKISQQAWKKLFVNTGEFFIKEFDRADEFLDDLSKVFSQENMSQLSRQIDKDDGLTLSTCLTSKILELMKSYDIPLEIATSYTNRFMIVILNYVKEHFPNQNTQIYLSNMQTNLESHLSIIDNHLTEIRKTIKKANENEVAVLSIADIEYTLLTSTDTPKLGLDFFSIDDDEFKLAFKEQIKNDKLYIRCHCKEEGIYMILNEILLLQDPRVTLVVKSFEEWEKLRKTGISNCILIPWFYKDEILAIDGNTSIFVYGSNEFLAGKKSLSIRKRTMRNIIHALTNAGLDSCEAHKLVVDTHGFFIPIKRRIIRGAYNKSPNWITEKIEVLLTAMLCERWTSSEGDQQIIEQISGIPYSEFISIINRTMNGEDPLVIRYSNHQTSQYSIVSPEDAWDILDERCSREMEIWDVYVETINQVISKRPEAYDIELHKFHSRQFSESDKECSKLLKNGLLSSLVMRAYYKSNNESQITVDAIVSSIWKNVCTVDDWSYYSQFVEILIEASPEVILSSLEKELTKTNSPFVNMMIQSNTISNYHHDFCCYLKAVEQLLVQAQYSIRAVNLLFSLRNVAISEKMQNEISDVIKEVFCAWHTITSLTTEQRKHLASKYVSTINYAWSIFYDLLPGNKTSAFSDFSTPKYRSIDSPDPLSRNEVIELYYEYTHACLENINGNVDRIIQIVKIIGHFNEDLVKTIVQVTRSFIENADDYDKMQIKNAIRIEVYKNRHFATARWALKSWCIEELERLESEIVFLEEEYDYVYLFYSQHEFPLSHPVLYSDDNSLELNAKAMEIELESKLSEFRSKQLRINKLIRICATNYDYLGERLARFYSHYSFSEEIYKDLLELSSKTNVLGYVREIYRKNNEDSSVIKAAIQLAEGKMASAGLLASLYAIQHIKTGDPLLILNEKNNEIVALYWGENLWFDNTDIIAKWVITESILKAPFEMLVQRLFYTKDLYSPIELLEIFELMSEKASSLRENQMTHYYLSEMLELLQKTFAYTPHCVKVATIEIKMRDFLEWKDMLCTKTCMQESPLLYLELTRLACKTDDGFENEKRNQPLLESVFSLFMSVEFCPAERNGSVEEQRLRNWLSVFDAKLAEQHQSSLRDHLLGSLLANSPSGDDGYFPCISVRKLIEEEFHSDEFRSAYCSAILNKRGAFWASAGREEAAFSEKYKENANALRTEYPHVAQIYDMLANWYHYQSEEERKSAENEPW